MKNTGENLVYDGKAGDGSVTLEVVGLVCLRKQLIVGVVRRFLIPKLAIPSMPVSFQFLVLLVVAVVSLMLL